MSRWRRIEFEEVCRLVQGRTVVKSEPGYPNSDRGRVYHLTGGLILGGVSKWTGPYSADTPDIEADPPEWYVLEDVG